jgi:hypothetical protein
MHEEPKHFDNLTTEQLIERTELTWLRYIKLCQDNFLMFVQEMWPQFICRKEKNEKDWGHHQIIANEFQKIANLEMFVYERIPKQRDVGKLIKVVNIMQRVLEPQLQVEVRTY